MRANHLFIWTSLVVKCQQVRHQISGELLAPCSKYFVEQRVTGLQITT